MFRLTKYSSIGSLVFPVTHLSYRSPEFVTDPEVFNGERWIGSGKTAAMTGPGYLAFGLGRWACPGRILAVTGIYSFYVLIS